MKARFLVASAVVAVGLMVAPAVFAATPTLALSGVGNDSVQATVTGDPNSTVVMWYNIGSSAGAQTTILGTTDSSGNLAKTVSVSALGLDTSKSVYLMIASQQSATYTWSSSSAQTSTATAVGLSQSTVSLSMGQSQPVTIYGGSGSYAVNGNSNSSAVSTAVTGSTITVTGVAAGSATITLCDTVGRCTTLNVTVAGGTSVAGTISLSQSSVTVAVAGTATVTMSGGTGFYVSANSNTSVATYSLNNNTITFTGVANGSTILTLCSLSNSCGPINVTVGSGGSSTTSTTSGTTAATTQAIGFSVTSPTVPVGQTINITLTGASSYYVSTISNAIPVQASISGNVLYLSGVTAGTTSISVCATAGGCGTLSVTVGTAATTAAAPTTSTTPAATPATTTSVAVTTNNSASLLTTIQTMQSQLAQMLLVIQTMQSQLNQIVSAFAAVVPSATTSAGASSAVSVSTSFNGTFTSLLSLNSTGAEVTALQKKLIAGGYLTGSATGFFGPATQIAVKAYQKDHGLDQAGYVGAGTRAALNAQ